MLLGDSRRAKGKKIAALLSAVRGNLEGFRVLDVGCGGGFISEVFRDVVGPEGSVVGVDRVSFLPPESTVQFREMDGAKIPFADKSFDIVLSNHVIAHVGSRDDQISHLRELGRVFRPGGLIYVATPNRWAVMEANLRLPFLSWLPEWLRSPYVRAAGRGAGYDCRPVSKRELFSLAAEAGLNVRDVSDVMLRVHGEMESQGLSRRVILAMPRLLLRAVARAGLVPSFTVLLTPRSIADAVATDTS
jgi:SAM-dependent methyltransferase